MVPKQVVLITGASTGFGRLIAETLAHRGHTVFATMREVAGRNASNATEICALAQAESLPLHVLELDVTNEASAEGAMRDAVDQAGHIDVVINNAGYVLAGLAEAVTLEQARRQMDTNFFGTVIVNRAALPHMRRQQSGLLLHISSGAGRLALPGYGFYCASKFALEALAESYRYELAGQGIDSCIVEPGPYRTAVGDNSVRASDEERLATYGTASQMPEKILVALMKSAGNAQDVADAVLAIIETPAGKRQVRYRVSPADFGTDELNALADQLQQRLFQAFDLTAETAFIQRIATANASA